MNAQRQFGMVNQRLKKTTEKLSSGYQINRAADDAAGLTISEKMRSQIRGLNQADKNVQEGITLIQIADGAMSETQDILQRMNELAVKSANGTNTSADRDAIHKEIIELKSELDRIAGSTEFNTMKILDGSLQRTTTTTQSNQKFLENIKGSWVTDAFSRIEAQTGWTMQQDMSIGFDIRDLGNKVIASSSYGNDTDVTITFNSFYMSDDISYGQSGPEIGGYLADRLITSQLTDVMMRENVNAENIPNWFSQGLSGALIGEEINLTSPISAQKLIDQFDYKGNEYSRDTALAGVLAVGYLHELDTDMDGTSEWNNLMTELKTASTFENAVLNAYERPLNWILDTMKQDAYDAAALGSATLTAFFDNQMGYNIGDINADSLIDTGSLETMVPNGGTPQTIQDSGDQVTYNGHQINLVWPDYKAQNTMCIHMGASADEFLRFGIGDMSASGILGVDYDVNLTTQEGARRSIAVIKEGIDYVSEERSRIGAIQNRLEYASRNLTQTSENTQAAESRIRDTDVASEMVRYSKDNILAQAGQAMMSQANQQSAGILALLQ